MRKILVITVLILVATLGYAWQYLPFRSLDKLIEESPVIVLATGRKVSDRLLLNGLEEWNCVFKHVLRGKAPINKRVSVLSQADFIPKFTNLGKEACLLFLLEHKDNKIQYMSTGNSRAVLPATVPDNLSSLNKMKLKESIKFLVQSYLKDKKSDIANFEKEVLKK